MKMSETIKPKSDQLNADDLLCKNMVIKIRDVTHKEGADSPVSIYFDGDNNKPYKPCLSMRRVMILATGIDDPTIDQFKEVYIGTSIKIYRDPAVKWAGKEVGGIRITHMSHLTKSFTIALTASSNSKNMYTVETLKIEKPIEKHPEALQQELTNAHKEEFKNCADLDSLKEKFAAFWAERFHYSKENVELVTSEYNKRKEEINKPTEEKETKNND